MIFFNKRLETSQKFTSLYRKLRGISKIDKTIQF